MDLEIVYEDADVLVINKPSGLAVHKTSPTDPQQTLVDVLVERFPYLKAVGEDPIRPSIIHRLDKETSGLMMVAKNNQSFFYYKGLFQERKIQKQYLALVYGHPKSPSGTITAPLGKMGTKQTTQTKGKKLLEERDAITDYKVIQSFQNYSLVEVRPKTGRTHQIRVHLKSLGTPIVGDTLYAANKKSQNPEGITRLFLHAQQLTFVSQNGNSLVLEVDLPMGLQKILSTLE